MATFASFRGWAEPYLPGSLAVSIDQAIVVACREFCSKTHLWKSTVTFTPTDGVTSYTLSLPVDSEAVRVRTVNQDGQVVSPLQPDILGATNPSYITSTARVASFYSIPATNKIDLLPIPTGASLPAVSVHTALQPTIASTSLPQFLFDEWVEAITAGVLGRMLAQANKPWTDSEHAVYQRNEFMRMVNEAKYRAESGDSNFNSAIQVNPII